MQSSSSGTEPNLPKSLSPNQAELWLGHITNDYPILDCQYPHLVGNGYCNDETNNIHCAFDGGDCCYKCISKLYCSICKCLDENARKETVVNYPLVGDGYCQDEINTAECQFDGGDCCGPCINKEKCSECSCLNNITAKTPPNTLIGDGFCNDETNNANCNYDGGDCCGTCINTERCIECTCLDKVHGNGVPNIRVGDGFCNDEYNTLKCFYDGLDCCREPVNKELCSECLCHGKFFDLFERNYSQLQLTED